MNDDLKSSSKELCNDETIDIKALIINYLNYWQWFVASLLLCLIVAVTFIHYTTPIYNVSASVLINDDGGSNHPSAINGINNLGIFSSTNNFDNEVAILQSQTLTTNTVNELGLYINYSFSNNLKRYELYKDSPITVWMTQKEASSITSPIKITINSVKDGGFIAEFSIGDKEFTERINSLPSIINTPKGVIYFMSADKYKVSNKWDSSRTLNIQISNPEVVATSLNSQLNVKPSSKSTTIAEIAIEIANKQKGIDFINKLIEVYNRDANDAKNEVATKTAAFINDRIAIIDLELGATEAELESFKKNQGITDIKSDAQMALNESSVYKQKRVENSTQLQLIQFLKEYVCDNNYKYEVLPINVGLSDATLSSLIIKLNDMLLDRERLLLTSMESNPAVVTLDASIEAMYNNVVTTIESVEQGLLITQRELENESQEFAGRIVNTPSQEREFVSISRQQEIKAGLYLMLLQKREENALTLASTANNARIIDSAKGGALPISPNKKMIILLAFFLGLAIPIIVIYIIDLLRFKIRNREDVTKITSIPIIGETPINNNIGDGSIFIRENHNGLMEETFRNIRTNIMYMLNEGQKVVLVTSTSAGEGKSTISSNTAISLALLGKRVIIIGLDIRKPGLNKALNLPTYEKGISNYLANPNGVDLLSLIHKSTISSNLDILVGGAIPPNPTELVSRNSLDMAIDILKQRYDYIIIDSAPAGMVTDTKIIARVADLCVYVCRANYTHKADFDYINELHRELKSCSICTVINSVDTSVKRYGRHYGYGYGYGY